MANLNFQNAKVLGVSQTSNFIGGDVFRLSTTQTIEIEGFFKVPNSNWGTVTQEDGTGVGNPPSNFDNIQAEIVQMKSSFLSDEGFSTIILNGVEIGQGKIISLDFPSSGDITEDSITFGKYVASIEVYTAASSVNAGYTNTNVDLYDSSTVSKINSYAVNIEDFSESFDFDISEDDSYNYSHEISLNLRKVSDTEFDSKTIAQEIAVAILELSNTLNAKLGYIDNRYKEYLRKIEGTANYSENYDELQHEYTFSKNLSILSRYTETEFYSAKITHAIAVSNVGIINVTESGEIKGMKVDDGKYINAKTAMNTEIGYSSERCNTIYEKYKLDSGATGILFDQKYGEEQSGREPESLSAESHANTLKRAIKTSKRFNSFDGTVSYDVEYTDDPKIGTSFSHQYTLELAKDSSNITTITQRGTIIPYEDKRPDFTRTSNGNPILGANSFYKEATKLEDAPASGDLLHSNGEINALYQEVEANKLLYKYQMTNSSVTFPKFGVTISYSRTFSDDTAILDPSVNNGIKRLSLSYDNNAPVRIKSTHLVPNMKENVTDSDQISLGERVVSINAVVERDFTKTNKIGKETQDANNGDDAITFQRAKLNTGLTKVIKEAKLNILFLNSVDMPAESYDIYPRSCSYSINSSNQIEFRLGAEYVFKNGRHFSDLDSFFIEEAST